MTVTHTLESMVPSRCNSFGKIRRNGLFGGGVSLFGFVFRIFFFFGFKSALHSHLDLFLPDLSQRTRCKLLAIAPAPCLRA